MVYQERDRETSGGIVVTKKMNGEYVMIDGWHHDGPWEVYTPPRDKDWDKK